MADTHQRQTVAGCGRGLSVGIVERRGWSGALGKEVLIYSWRRHSGFGVGCVCLCWCAQRRVDGRGLEGVSVWVAFVILC